MAAAVVLGPSLGQLVADERRRQKMSRRRLAAAIGVPARSLRRFERGADAPSIAQAALATLGVTASSILPERAAPQVDLVSGIIAIDDRVASVRTPIRDIDDVLVPYLRLLGGVRRGVIADFRRYDIDVIADATGAEPERVMSRLEQLARRSLA